MPPEQVDAKTAHLDLLAQLVRALPCHGRGRGFKSHTDRKGPGPITFCYKPYYGKVTFFPISNYDTVDFFPVLCDN